MFKTLILKFSHDNSNEKVAALKRDNKNKIKIKNKPLLRFRIMNQITSAALAKRTPKAAIAMPTMTTIGISAFSNSSAGTLSTPLTYKKKIKTKEN